MPPLITRPAPIATERVQTTSALSKIQEWARPSKNCCNRAGCTELIWRGQCLETGVGREGRTGEHGGGFSKGDGWRWVGFT